MHRGVRVRIKLKGQPEGRASEGLETRGEVVKTGMTKKEGQKRGGTFELVENWWKKRVWEEGKRGRVGRFSLGNQGGKELGTTELLIVK